MISRALNSDGDIYFQGARSAFVSDSAEVAQHVSTRLKFFLGEWFLDENAGTPWYQSIFVKPADLAQIEINIKNRILQTGGVTDLVTFNMRYSPRELVVDFTYTDEYGGISTTVEVFNG